MGTAVKAINFKDFLTESMAKFQFFIHPWKQLTLTDWHKCEY